MNVKSPDPNWVDPDEAPELTEEWFASASYQLAEKSVTREEFKAAVVKRGRPVGSVKAQPKQQATLRLDADVLAALRASGKGWQTRAAAVLRQYAIGARE